MIAIHGFCESERERRDDVRDRAERSGGAAVKASAYREQPPEMRAKRREEGLRIIMREMVAYDNRLHARAALECARKEGK